MCTVFGKTTFEEVFKPIVANLSEALIKNIPLDTFGNKIKHERLSRGLSQGELGKLVGYSLTNISAWENGYGYPRPFNLKLITQKLKMDYKHFASSSDYMYE